MRGERLYSRTRPPQRGRVTEGPPTERKNDWPPANRFLWSSGAVILLRLEHILGHGTKRAYPIVRNVLERGPRRDARIRIPCFRIVDIPADGADVFLHHELSPSLVIYGEISASPPRFHYIATSHAAASPRGESGRSAWREGGDGKADGKKGVDGKIEKFCRARCPGIAGCAAFSRHCAETLRRRAKSRERAASGMNFAGRFIGDGCVCPDFAARPYVCAGDDRYASRGQTPRGGRSPAYRGAWFWGFRYIVDIVLRGFRRYPARRRQSKS